MKRVENSKRDHGNLVFAVMTNDFNSLKLAVETRANVDGYDSAELSIPLFLAVKKSYDLTAYLLSRGADPNFSDKMGFTPLHTAADAAISCLPEKRAEHVKILNLLTVGYQADWYKRDSFNKSPLDIIYQNPAIFEQVHDLIPKPDISQDERFKETDALLSESRVSTFANQQNMSIQKKSDTKPVKYSCIIQ